MYRLLVCCHGKRVIGKITEKKDMGFGGIKRYKGGILKIKRNRKS